MKADKVGEVIVRADTVIVQGWLVSRDETDDPTVDTEQLLAEFATKWARGRLEFETNRAQVDYFKRLTAGQPGN